MLLNLTHEITKCGLPSHIQERYVRYKQGNRAIVSWMTKYGPEKYKGRKTLPIKQLIALGQSLCDRVQELGSLPANVDYYFTEVIRERAYLSRHFRGFRDKCEQDEIDTVNHEHFTKSLREIHQILLTAGRPHVKDQRTSLQSHSSLERRSDSLYSPVNCYQHLALDSSSDIEDEDGYDRCSVTTADTGVTSECCHELHTAECLGKDATECEDFLDLEGALAVSVEVSMFMERVNNSFEVIKSYWSRAGRSEISIVAATCMTNFTCTKLLEHEKLCRNVIERDLTVSNLREFLGRYNSCNDMYVHLNGSTVSNDTLEMLEQIDIMIKSSGLASSRTMIEKPHEYITTKPMDTTARSRLVQGLVCNICHSADTSRLSHLSYQSIPYYEMLIDELRSKAERRSSISFTLIISALYISYVSYIQESGRPALASRPRIKALQLASECASSIRKFIDDQAIFPCQCVNTLAYRLSETIISLEAFAKDRSWTLLMQSPYVAGNQVLEILDLCSYYGMHLFHYRHYCGAILHSYNVMITIGGMERIPIMEELCLMFKDVLFTGGDRPNSNFTSSWYRYIGARLKFRNGRKEKNHKDTWCMSIPAHVASKAAGLNIEHRNVSTMASRFDYGSIDFLTKLKRSGWQTGDMDNNNEHSNRTFAEDRSRTLSEFGQNKSSRKSSRSVHSRKSSYSDEEGGHLTNDVGSFSPVLSSITACLEIDDKRDNSQMSNGRLPSARLNLFAVFHTMTRVIRRISNATHDASSTADKGSLCLCFVTLLLRAADRIQDTRRKSARLDVYGATLTKNERECLSVLRDAILAEVEGDSAGKDRKGWLWTF